MYRVYDKKVDDKIIRLYAEGNQVKEIAAELSTTYAAIKMRVEKLKERYQARTVTQLVVKYLKIKE